MRGKRPVLLSVRGEPAAYIFAAADVVPARCIVLNVSSRRPLPTWQRIARRRTIPDDCTGDECIFSCWARYMSERDKELLRMVGMSEQQAERNAAQAESESEPDGLTGACL